MRRAEVWRTLILGRSERRVVIVGHNTITEERDDVICVQVHDTPGGAALLTVVEIDQPVSGFVRAFTVGAVGKRWFQERLGVLDSRSMERVDIALRAALDL